MALRPRLLRTYSRRAGYLRPLPPPERWISPPQDRKRLFSSTPSAGSSALSASSAGCSPADDPDYSPPGKRRLQALGNRPAGTRRLRTRRRENREPAGKENREPAGKENREPAGKENREPAGKENRGRVQESRGRGKGSREAAGKGNREAAGKGNREAAGKGNREAAGKGNREAAGKGNREAAGKGSREAAGKGSREAAGKGSREAAGKGSREAAGKGSREAAGKESREPAGKENRGRVQDSREPAGKDSREPAGKENREPAGKKKKKCSQRKEPRWRREEPRGSSALAARPPLLCSTPQWAPPPRRALPALLSSAADSASSFADSPPALRRRRPAVRLSSLLLSTSIEGGSGLGADEEVPEWFPVEGLAPSCEPEPRGCGRAARRGSALRSPQEAPGAPRGALPPGGDEPQPPAPWAAGEGLCQVPSRLSGESARRRSSCHRDGLVPVVVLDPREVPKRLRSAELKEGEDVPPACLQPGSLVGRRGISETKHKGTKAVSGEGSPCRKACISGFSASRWGGRSRLRPKGRKNKRQQEPNNSVFRPQTRQKQTRKGALELSLGGRDNDYSLLNSSYSWARVQASLSLHKKKKVTTDETFCCSILCTPSGKCQLSGYQASLSAGKAEGCSSFASSLVLLAPRDSSSVLELLLTDADKVFGECNQEGPIAFEDCIPLNTMKQCQKIGEGVFGEVFQIDSKRGPVALKIIPIEGTEKINGEAQKSFGEILPEIIISKELSLLSEGSVNRTGGFISLYSVHCVQGAYPMCLLAAWDKFRKETGSENDRPDFFGAQQLFMVLEFEFGGSDLEQMRRSLSSVASARSILHQVTASLAVAEQELHFEHRDLHLGNVLVKRTDVRELQYVLGGETHSIPTAGIHVNIIDYTLSRLEKDGLTVFCDLSTDQELFQGIGDYQFDIYREMKEENSNNWTEYHPHSNVLWLHYLADKFLKGMSYKRKATTPALKKIKAQLSKFHKEVLTFQSAHDVLLHSSLFQ